MNSFSISSSKLEGERKYKIPVAEPSDKAFRGRSSFFEFFVDGGFVEFVVNATALNDYSNNKDSKYTFGAVGRSLFHEAIHHAQLFDKGGVTGNRNHSNYFLEAEAFYKEFSTTTISAKLSASQQCYYLNWAIFNAQKASANGVLSEQERNMLKNWTKYFQDLRDKPQPQ